MVFCSETRQEFRWYFVAKLVKSFGGLCNAAETLDEFRYRKVCFSKGNKSQRCPKGCDAQRPWPLAQRVGNWKTVHCYRRMVPPPDVWNGAGKLTL